MIYVSNVKTSPPEIYKTPLQSLVYQTLELLDLSFERVDTDEAISIEDCAAINKRLDVKIVKTLFLCNRQQTSFYLFVTKGDKPFSSKAFSQALGVSRVSFAPVERMEAMLGTKVGAATVFSALWDKGNDVQMVFDKDVLAEEWYGCSDGTTTGYMKIRTEAIVRDFLPFANHRILVIGGQFPPGVVSMDESKEMRGEGNSSGGP